LIFIYAIILLNYYLIITCIKVFCKLYRIFKTTEENILQFNIHGKPTYDDKFISNPISPGTYDFSSSPWPADEIWQWRAVDPDGHACYYKVRPKIQTYKSRYGELTLWDANDDDCSEEFAVLDNDSELFGDWDTTKWEDSLEARF
jgi:hypothetical protein